MKKQFMGILLAAIFLVGGCASNSTSTSYILPNWIDNDNIVFIKKTIETVQGNLLSPGTTIVAEKYYLMSMPVSGSLDGATTITEVTGVEFDSDISLIGPEYTPIVSPSGNYVVVHHKVYTMSGTLFKELPSSLHVVDWANNESQMIYVDSSLNFLLRTLSDGSDFTVSTDISGACWKYGEFIVFTPRGVDTNYFICDENGENVSDLGYSGGGAPQMTPGYFYSQYGAIGEFFQQVLSTGEVTTLNFTSSFVYAAKFSPNDAKIVYGNGLLHVIDVGTNSDTVLP